ncbi:hypothetical protein LDL08_41325 [Nonomuraea glycinis]|uniref:Uncharacterized protein n=1 Tax=Nonomuraea glycinis TaxID=2047744 RepID=A0A918AET8_9ACTN|nr:hypothetical protein [Nonomuraea glycinis]MCA2182624.1 hypothetical protein [Nonomuraea glycinis]GGP16839.1 hypothetical protein GCM10012278_82240 [Nonomuraea glycinis]
MNCEDLEARYGREWNIHPLRWGVAAVRKRVPTPEQFAQGYLYALIGANPDDLASHLDRQPDQRPTQGDAAWWR